ncbi:MAG: hypothetical protein KDD53_11250, partial [Bdellovibrionales bacterium]|nr:hypothetical protein [Bdellovibrionales bacterium]
GISIIPAASGVESICDLSLEDRMLLLAEIENSALSFDYLLIDTRAGISSDVMYFNSASSEIVIVINPEPTSLTDAYAMVKVLCSQYGEKRFSVISNNVKNAAEGAQTFEQLQRVVNRFLQVQLKYLGYVPNDSLVSAAVKSQRGLLEIYPTSPAGLALSALARKIDEDFQYQVVKGGMQFFFRHLLEQSVVRS